MGCEVKTVRLSGFVLQNRPSALNDEEEQKPGIRLVSMCFPPTLRTRTSRSNREKRAENTTERSPGQQSKAGPGASHIHRPPHLRHPLKSSLLTARTEPPSPSPAASLSNRRGEPRCAAEIKGEDPGGGLDEQQPGRSGASERREGWTDGRMDGCSRSLARSHRDSFFCPPGLSPLNHINKGSDHVTHRRPLPHRARPTLFLRKPILRKPVGPN